MIPKIIHFCWFGGNPLPELAQKCIASWRKYLPEYEIWQWSERPLHENVNVIKDNQDNWDNIELAQRLNFLNQRSDLNSLNERSDLNQRKARLEHPITRVMEFDVEMIPYTAEAYRQKKYAFVSDYARFWILYKYGGIYFDTDVEVIRPMDEIIAKGNFMGFETDYNGDKTISVAPGLGLGVNPGLGLGVNPGLDLIKELLDYYQDLQFVFNPDGKDQLTIVGITTEVLLKRGLKYVSGIQKVDDVTIYPSEYFCPINITTKRLHITKNTCTIHHYAASWMDKKFSLKDMVRGFIPEWLLLKISECKRMITRKG